MYYILVKQENILKQFIDRKIITVATKAGHVDLVDESSLAIPPKAIIPKETFDEVLKYGYSTKEDAENDKETKKEIDDYIGVSFYKKFSIVDENELKSLYKRICNNENVFK